MTLKQQIEATIAAYQEACKPENLNYNYCVFKLLRKGICYYAMRNNYDDLYRINAFNFTQEYICLNPENVKDNPEEILPLHQTRLKYLQNLLNQITNETN